MDQNWSTGCVSAEGAFFRIGIINGHQSNYLLHGEFEVAPTGAEATFSYAGC